MQLCKRTEVVSYHDFRRFFKKEWAPIILKIHEPRGDTITNFIGDIVAELQDMPTHQVFLLNLIY